MKINWTNATVDNLLSIHDSIAQNSRVYADRIISKIIRRSEQLAPFPLSGRIVPEYNRREVRDIIEGTYRVVYIVNHQDETIDILAVLHTAQAR
jgi:toxin ParE1/3/4